MHKAVVLCITGASGVIYAVSFLEHGLRLGLKIHCIISSNARLVLEDELGITYEEFKRKYSSVTFHEPVNFRSPLASGSFLKRRISSVVVLPCSVSTLGKVANGCGSNLIHRVCDVAIKESVPLLMAVREMPLSAIHLENMLKLQKIGVKVFPISPAFYSKPQSLKDLVDFTVGKIFDLLGVDNDIYNRWGEEKEVQ